MEFFASCDTLGSKVFLRSIENGKLVKKIIDYHPELYIKTNNASKAVAKSIFDENLERIEFTDNKEMKSFIDSYADINGFSIYGSKSIFNQYISKNYPNKISYEQKHIRGGVLDIETFSGDIDSDGNVIQGPFPDPEAAAFPISMLTLYCTRDSIYHVWATETFKGRHLGTYVHDKAHPRVGNLNIDYRKFDDEYSMLMDFVDFWNKEELHYWSGWYITGFDNPYMTNRIEKVCGESIKKKLSPWGIVKSKKNKNDWGQETTEFDYMGCQMLDYLDLTKKYGFLSPDNWRLSTLAEMILGEGKVDYSDEGSINDLYIKNFSKSVIYNVIDVDLVVQMNKKKKFFETTFMQAYITKSNYRDTLATVRPWSALSFSMLHDQGVMPRIKELYQGDTKFGGGFVRDVTPGRYNWIVNFDLNSLYPHCIQAHNMGQDTIIEPEDLPLEIRNIPNFTLDDLLNKRVDLSALKRHNISMTPNRQFFRKVNIDGKMSMYNKKTREIYDTRKDVKKEMLLLEQKIVDISILHNGDLTEEAKIEIEELLTQTSFMDIHQNSLKLLMNSMYGALGNRYMVDYFDIRIAESITTNGQLAVLWIARKTDEYLNKALGLGEVLHKIHHRHKPAETRLEVVKGHNFSMYQDTDSNYVDMTLLVDKFFTKEQQVNEQEKVINFLDALCKTKLEPYMNDSFIELADYINADHRMFMKRETIALNFIIASAKKYTMQVADKEGVRYFPKLKHKIVGLDAVRVSFPRFCREWMKDAYLICMTGNESELQAFTKDKKAEFMKVTIDKIASIITVNDLAKYHDPDTVYIKGTTKQAKASLHHNRLLDKYGITNVNKIQSADKILYVGLRQPNPHGIDTIAFKGNLPVEFGLHKFVDYETNWNKNFVSPMDNLLKTIKWNSSKQASVMDWFDD